MERPWLKFHTRDWLDNKELRRCSPTSRSVLADLMCLAHEGLPYGYLTDKLGPLTEEYMAARCVLSIAKFRAAIQELKNAQRLSESEGQLFIQRMLEDEKLRIQKIVGGSKGGNPHLAKKVNQGVNGLSRERAGADSDSGSDSDSASGSIKSSSSNLLKEKLLSVDDDEKTGVVESAKPSDNPKLELSQMLESKGQELIIGDWMWFREQCEIRGIDLGEFVALLRPHMANPRTLNAIGLAKSKLKHHGMQRKALVESDIPQVQNGVEKCPLCASEKGRGLVLENGSIVLCACATDAFRVEHEAKEREREARRQAAPTAQIGSVQ